MGENSRKSIQGKSLESPDPKNILVLHPDLLRSLEPDGINQDGQPLKNILLAVECPAGRVPEANDSGTFLTSDGRQLELPGDDKQNSRSNDN
jgi:hypothetical protein